MEVWTRVANVIPLALNQLCVTNTQVNVPARKMSDIEIVILVFLGTGGLEPTVVNLAIVTTLDP